MQASHKPKLRAFRFEWAHQSKDESQELFSNTLPQETHVIIVCITQSILYKQCNYSNKVELVQFNLECRSLRASDANRPKQTPSAGNVTLI